MPASSDRARRTAEVLSPSPSCSTARHAASRIDRSIATSIALLPYSSGTTGLPKGVMLTHRQLVTVGRQITRALGVDDHDVTLAVAPWFHILGVTAALLVPLTARRHRRRRRRASSRDLVPGAASSVYRVTYLAGPPPIAAFLAYHPSVCRTRPRLPRTDRQSAAHRCRAAGPRSTAPPAPRLRGRPGLGPDRDERGASASHVATERHGAGHGRSAAPEHRAPGDRPRQRDAEVGPEVAGELQRPRTADDARLPRSTGRDGGDDHRRTDGSAPATSATSTTHGGVVVVDRLKELIKVNAFQVAPG